jgi:hypothetical protein
MIRALSKKFDMFKNFSHVNSVFRLNKFVPDDKGFDLHYDTPYYDSQKKQCSKFTILIYLTSGKGANSNPTLLIKDGSIKFKIDSIEEGTCIIFDQKYLHKGVPYETGDKVFIRSELIFNCRDEINSDPKLKKIFSSACYMFRESIKDTIFSRDMAKYSSELFNRSAESRFNLQNTSNVIDTIYLHKIYRDISFVTNGYDYWFPKLETKSKKEYMSLVKLLSIIAITDYFKSSGKCNANDIVQISSYQKVHGLKFIRTIVKKVYELQDKRATSDDIESYLNEVMGDKSNYWVVRKNIDLNSEECCSYHHMNNFDPKKCHSVINHLYEKQMVASKEINKCTLVIFGNKIEINPDDVHIDNNIVSFPKTGTYSRVNFAACWNGEESPQDYVKIEKGRGFHLPNIPYGEKDGVIHFILDMFHNDFTLAKNNYSVKKFSV